MKKWKVLNLYAGIGGNRKLWNNVDVTAIDNNYKIVDIYKELFPNDDVIITDAHKYLLKHFKEYDFIWSSPPCPTHSRIRFFLKGQNTKNIKDVYPDMKLYEEIIFLDTWFNNKWCIENVISYYTPLIKPYECENHYFWTNFNIPKLKKNKRNLIRITTDKRIKYMSNKYNIDLSKFNITKTLKSKILSNCVNPEIGLYILNCARKNIQKNIEDF